ncbi:hypothetical protein EPUS_04101 [Endocarpon pusillum Z07020]|uniref:Uncharacterized protein n=1 Tax=Endocarpon pusillum (strain Z07020 / HMAS-L-300199) TaxID=1263415 RepID=U1GMI6_ENDPU|nr:uncharacterized protein EPUS_04101 [Endocarpon pusillum Z07020]ERF73478.1 hypothetical protein EPUS_04101 [Endocarpon pusillum Z07020]
MQDRVWLVTGATSDIGREIALHALQRGDTVVAAGRRPEALQDLARMGCKILVLDITSSAEEFNHTVEDVTKKVGRIEMLINAAGFLLEGCMEETSDRELLQVYSTNLFGLLRLRVAVLPQMRSRRQGVIANVARIGALQVAIGAGVFCSSKAAMTCATEALHAETSPLGINVCSIQLGHFRTAFLSPGPRLKTQITLADCDVFMESTRKIFDDFDGSQQGDSKEAGRVIVEVLIQSERAEGRCIPGCLAVGSDVAAATEKVQSSREVEMKAWALLSHSTDLTGS